MGGVSTPGGDGLNVDLNVVPFIDLLSALVLFLLLGAVWVQISAMKASVDAKGGAATEAVAPPPSKRVEVRVIATGYELKWPSSGRLPNSLMKKSGAWDLPGLSSVMASALKTGVVDSASVGGIDGVPYGQVVLAIDAVRDAGIARVALSAE